MATITPDEIARLQAYFQTTFGREGLAIQIRDKAPESAEVNINGEFIGVIYKDEEDGETSYDFNMAILDIDLPQTAGSAA